MREFKPVLIALTIVLTIGIILDRTVGLGEFLEDRPWVIPVFFVLCVVGFAVIARMFSRARSTDRSHSTTDIRPRAWGDAYGNPGAHLD